MFSPVSIFPLLGCRVFFSIFLQLLFALSGPIICKGAFAVVTKCPIMGVCGSLAFDFLDFIDLSDVTVVCDDDESLLHTGLYFFPLVYLFGISWSP